MNSAEEREMHYLNQPYRFTGQSIVSIDQLHPDGIMTLCMLAQSIKNTLLSNGNTRITDTLADRRIAVMFTEPSTRTKFSFLTAIDLLGGTFMVEDNALKQTSITKGESWEGTLRMLMSYAHGLVIRTSDNGLPRKLADFAKASGKRFPIFNGGDGVNEHPTQALLDMFTIREHYGRLHSLSVLIAGDLEKGRTVRSLLRALALFPKNHVSLLSHPSMALPNEEVEFFRTYGEGLDIDVYDEWDKVPPDDDVWYWTRVQTERTDKGSSNIEHPYVITPQTYDLYARKENGPIIMHPLPNAGEISPEMDSHPMSRYLTQAANGVPVRTALLKMVYEKM